MKKVNQSFFAVVIACVVALGISSCMNLGLDPSNVNNTLFGSYVGGYVDVDQDWNLAQQSSVTVKVASESRVRVYASDGNNYKIVANKTISGTETLYFDVVEGRNKLIVINFNGGMLITTKVGGVADFTQNTTKTVLNTGSDVVKASINDSYTAFYYNTILNDIYSNPDPVINKTATRIQGVSKPFKDLDNSVALFYSKTGEFSLTPVWYTNESGESATIGVYYYDNSGNKVDVPIFKNDKQNDMLQYNDKYSGWQTYWDAHMPSLEKYGNFYGDYIRSKRIDVKVPAGCVFGFYIIGGYDNSCRGYSEGSYSVVPDWACNENPGVGEGKHWINDAGLGKFGHVAVINIKDGTSTRNYLGFDDWYEGNAHQYYYPEYDHLVFMYSGDIAPVGDGDGDGDGDGGNLNDDPIVWSLACEDLGESADYDFNDVVLNISHVAGETVAHCVLVAAGGTLCDQIRFEQTEYGEVHEMFKVTLVTMVNTEKTGCEKNAVSFDVEVPADFTMSDVNMGGFQIVRTDEEGKNILGVVAAPEKGQVPYMICVPSGWMWPWEMTRITDAYPAFATWCADHNQAKDWYLNCIEENVFKSELANSAEASMTENPDKPKSE